MARLHHLLDLVGNRDTTAQQPGWTYPLPDDDSWSCDGTDELLGTVVDQNNPFEDESMGDQPPLVWPNTPDSHGESHRETCEGDNSQTISGTIDDQSSRHTTRVCRAASGSTATSFASAISVGEQTRSTMVENFHIRSQPQNITVAGEEQHQPISCEPQQGVQILHPPSVTPAAPHGPCLKITGGALTTPTPTYESGQTSPCMSTQFYASTTDLLLQNLTMVVGNPSTRCFANAPWRAFCWMCAYLAEFNRDPWGVVKDAVQTSLELSEPVDIQRLPGMHPLWEKQEGDAAHFVHSLWVHSQTRVLQYRHTEIKEGGYVTGTHPNSLGGGLP